MIGKYFLTFIAFLFIILLVLVYVINFGGSPAIKPGKAYPADIDIEAPAVSAGSQASVGKLSSVSSGSPENHGSNTVPEFELEEKTRAGWQLVWNDEFSGSAVNDEYWTLQTGEDIWGNNELQYYTDRTENCFIKDGKLIIRGLREKYGNSDFTSARIVTKDKIDFLYGKIEIKAKLPKGTGLLSGVWFLPCRETYDDRLKNGEFDLAEMLGSDPSIIYGVAHYSYNDQKKTYIKYRGDVDYSEDFHVYSVEWDPQKIKWLVDGEAYFTFDFGKAFDESYEPFNKRFYLIINLAVGGDWPGDDLSKTDFPSSIEVDYVRYYK